jgi:hypothetical protein
MGFTSAAINHPKSTNRGLKGTGLSRSQIEGAVMGERRLRHALRKASCRAETLRRKKSPR